VNAIAKDSNDVAVSVKLAGLTKLTENIQGLLFGAPDAGTSPFGYGSMQPLYEHIIEDRLLIFYSRNGLF